MIVNEISLVIQNIIYPRNDNNNNEKKNEQESIKTCKLIEQECKRENKIHIRRK